jgi:hypothetical protein
MLVENSSVQNLLDDLGQIEEKIMRLQIKVWTEIINEASLNGEQTVEIKRNETFNNNTPGLLFASNLLSPSHLSSPSPSIAPEALIRPRFLHAEENQVNFSDFRRKINNTCTLSDEEIKKIDSKFKSALMSHPTDCEQIIDTHLQMVFNQDHPLNRNCVFISTWLAPYERVEQPSLMVLQKISESFEDLFVSAQKEIFKYYPFLKEKKLSLSSKTNQVLYNILWNIIYDNYFLMVQKHCAFEDVKFKVPNFELKRQMIKVLDFDLHPFFWLDQPGLDLLKNSYNTSTVQQIDKIPYEKAINILKHLPSYRTVQEKLKCLEDTSTQIIADVNNFWKGFSKEITVGADQFLPLMSYVVTKAYIPNIFTEALLMELLIANPNGKEGYLLISFQTALRVVLDTLTSFEKNRDVATYVFDKY